MALSRKAVGQIPTEAHDLNTTTVNKIGLEADAVLKKEHRPQQRRRRQGGAGRGRQLRFRLHDAGRDPRRRPCSSASPSATIWFATYPIGIASIVTPMQALGKGDLSADVPHQGEKTEIGAMADTLQVFKQALIAKKAADEAAAVDAEAKIERGRRVDGITRNFETVIGEIVQTVSSASTQLEASAGTLSATAERSQKLTIDGGRGFRRSLDQRAVGGVGDRRAVLVGHRDQPPGAGIGADGDRRRRPGPRHQRPGQRIVEGGEPHRRRRRAHQHHRRPDQSAGAQRHHRGGARRRSRPRLCRRGVGGEGAGGADGQGHRRDQPADRRHPGRDPGVGRTRSRKSAAPSNGCRRSPRRSRPPSKSRARRRRKFPATCSRRPGAPSRSPPTSPTCSAAPARPARPPRRCSRRRSRCRATATASSSRSASSWNSVRAA